MQGPTGSVKLTLLSNSSFQIVQISKCNYYIEHNNFAFSKNLISMFLIFLLKKYILSESITNVPSVKYWRRIYSQGYIIYHSGDLNAGKVLYSR